ncbi:hypothetical protein ACSBLW_00365 [Thioclava sp. FR2]|uniref:hypothetical protein n=1 Tax=Thioclava sp. FR2 TaxID=3445780 RepID=UPI003EC0D46C
MSFALRLDTFGRTILWVAAGPILAWPIIIIIHAVLSWYFADQGGGAYLANAKEADSLRLFTWLAVTPSVYALWRIIRNQDGFSEVGLIATIFLWLICFGCSVLIVGLSGLWWFGY